MKTCDDPGGHTIDRHVVVTGIGAFTALGRGVESFYEALRCGRTAVSQLFGIPVARQKDKGTQIRTIALSRPNRLTTVARAAVEEALQDSGLVVEKLNNIGFFMATFAGESNAIESRYLQFKAKKSLSPYLRYALVMFPNHAIADELAAIFGLLGPRDVNTNACASGNIAIARAHLAILQGQVDVAVVCGAEQLKPTMYWGAERSGIVGTDALPFHRNRDGTVFGDGAGALILEEQTHAHSRGARVYAEISGCGISCSDSPHEIIPQEDGLGVARSILLALEDAGIEPDAVEYINAHATGTVNIDKSECRGIKHAFGRHAYSIPVTATKSFTGHLSGASAILEIIACIFAIARGYIHPTAGLDLVDPELDLDFLPLVGTERKVQCAVSSSMGAGGVNTAVVVCSPSFSPRCRLGQNKHVSAAEGSTVDDTVCVSGTGLATPLGADLATLWSALMAQKAGLQNVPKEWASGSACRVGAFVNDEELEEMFPLVRSNRHVNRAARLGLLAASLAIKEAGLEHCEAIPGRWAVVVGTAYGGCTTWSRSLCDAFYQDPHLITPFMSLSHGYHLCATLIAREFKITGPICTLVGGCASGLSAVGYGFDLVRRSQADVVVVCGVDILDEDLFDGFGRMGALARCGDDPGAFHVFDYRHNGTVLGEGAGCIVLERRSHPLVRGKEPLGLISAHSSASAACGAGRYDPQGANLNRSMRNALEQCPHKNSGWALYAAANGIASLDMGEALAVHEVQRLLPDGNLLVTSLSSYLGDMGAASGVVSLIAGLATLRTKRVPPLLNLKQPAISGILYAPREMRPYELGNLFVNAASPGGACTSVICSAPQ